MTGVDGLNTLRESMAAKELEVVDELMERAYREASANDVTLSGDDRAAKAEAALCRWVINSRSGGPDVV